MLPPHSRRLADAHLRLGLALEFHPDTQQRAESEQHIAMAKRVLQKRITALEGDERPDNDDSLKQMSDDDAEREIADVRELVGDLDVKVRV